MLDEYKKFLATDAVTRRGVFDQASVRLGVPAQFIEKDFWVCLILQVLFDSSELKEHKLLFKGGTSLSKAYGLIHRFSEDIDIVVFREDLGFDASRDPTDSSLEIGNNKRKELFEALRESCNAFMSGSMKAEIEQKLSGLKFEVSEDPDDPDHQTLLVQYESIYKSLDYVRSVVKIEGGARSGLDPHEEAEIKPYIADELVDFDFKIKNVRTLDSGRTLWEKILILHWIHCGYRDDPKKRKPSEQNRMSRHYYDVYMILKSDHGLAASKDIGLLTIVRNHNLVAFNQKWKKFDEAFPGSIKLVPQPEVLEILKRDYSAMSGMMIGEAPPFDEIIERVSRLEEDVNKLTPVHTAAASPRRP